MQTLLTQYATVLLLAGVAFSLFALRNAIRQFNQSRRAPYYILREEATRSAGRWTLASIVGIVATIGIALYAAQAPPLPASVPTATASAPVPTIGPTPTPRLKPTQTSSPTPTSPPSLTPTATLAPDVPDVLLTPLPGAVPPDPAASFEFLTLASRIDDNLNPVDPGLQFPANTGRVYAFFRATNVNNGAPWGLFCYRDGTLVDLFVGLWDDGPRAQTSRAFCAQDGVAGTYQLRVYLSTRLAFEVEYTLAGAAPAPTQPAPTDTPPPEDSPTPAP